MKCIVQQVNTQIHEQSDFLWYSLDDATNNDCFIASVIYMYFGLNNQTKVMCEL